MVWWGGARGGWRVWWVMRVVSGVVSGACGEWCAWWVARVVGNARGVGGSCGG